MKTESCESRAKKAESRLGAVVLETKMKVLGKIFLLAIVAPALLYTLFFLFLHYQAQLIKVQIKEVEIKEKRPTYWAYVQKGSFEHLNHVFNVLGRLGFQRVDNNESDWDLLWSFPYPFIDLSLYNLEHHQRVNHIPGCGYFTNKVDLATTKGKFIPTAFRIPEDKDALMEHARQYPDKTFVQKSNSHRGIRIKNIKELDLNQSQTFVQEFVERPYLIDGHKFDIGIYTVVTSVDPLRIYVYKGDVLFRFCPVPYYPFDPEMVGKYVVEDDYMPIWDVPSLADTYTRLGFSAKETFDAHLRGKGKDPVKVWEDCYEAIKEVVLQKSGNIRNSMKRYRGTGNFYEMVRFDLLFDEDMNVYIMEANMSPNLSSAHYAPNQLLYEQVLYNLFALLGIGQRVRKESMRERSIEEEDMIVANKNLVVFPEMCSNCHDCFSLECQLCQTCFTDDFRDVLAQTYWEHYNKLDFLRIFPPPIKQNMLLKNYTRMNQLLIRWFQGKCASDPAWCN